MKRVLFSLASLISLTVALSGCGSSVKLSDVPVEDRAGTPGATTQPGTGGSGGAGGTGATAGQTVMPVDVAPKDVPGVGPAGVARVIYFDYDSITIRPEFQGSIESHARFLTANKGKKIAIEGHTDERGGREYNLALGQKRAEAVRRSLSLLGVVDAQVEAVSFGKEKPAAAGASEEAFAKNRRAEITYR